MKMNRHMAYGLTVLGLAISVGMGGAGLGINAAKAESRGMSDDATSVSYRGASKKVASRNGATKKVASRSGASKSTKSKTATKVASSERASSTRSLGLTRAATATSVSIVAPNTAATTRFANDPSRMVGRGSYSAKSSTPSTKMSGLTTKPYRAQIARHAKAAGVPVALALAVVRVESNYNPKVRGSAGEVGLMQIKPRTARGMGFTGSTKALYDPDTNLRWGMKYLAGAYKLAGGDTCGTIMRYQGGHYARRMSRVAVGYCSKVKRHMAGTWT